MQKFKSNVKLIMHKCRTSLTLHSIPDNKSIMITKESKKIIRTYNKVARALIEYETLWHHAVSLEF